ncbi:9633_t:CDS:1, partial [Ambispora leptoticha]
PIIGFLKAESRIEENFDEDELEEGECDEEYFYYSQGRFAKRDSQIMSRFS